MGLPVNQLRLDFKQSSFYHITRVLRSNGFSAFSPVSAFPACYCPLLLSVPGKPDDPGICPLNPSCLWQGYDVSYHGAHTTRTCRVRF